MQLLTVMKEKQNSGINNIYDMWVVTQSKMTIKSNNLSKK